jgi:hypothetical protein
MNLPHTRSLLLHHRGLTIVGQRHSPRDCVGAPSSIERVRPSHHPHLRSTWIGTVDRHTLSSYLVGDEGRHHVQRGLRGAAGEPAMSKSHGAVDEQSCQYRLLPG